MQQGAKPLLNIRNSPTSASSCPASVWAASLQACVVAEVPRLTLRAHSSWYPDMAAPWSAAGGSQHRRSPEGAACCCCRAVGEEGGAGKVLAVSASLKLAPTALRALTLSL